MKAGEKKNGVSLGVLSKWCGEFSFIIVFVLIFLVYASPATG